MKLQIKTMNKKSLLIEIEDTNTVLSLKKQLSLYSDVGVKPELQKLIYSGKVLANDNLLASYNIDEKKYLVVMILKHTEPITEELPAHSTQTKPEQTSTSSTQQQPPVAETETSEPVESPPKPTERSQNEQMVENIVNMGYPESEVRQALIASFYNPERAIEYLIEGIPSANAVDIATDFYMDGNESISLRDNIDRDPLLQDLRRSITQHPDLIQRAIQQIGETNPSIMNMINENPQEFLAALLDDDDE